MLSHPEIEVRPVYKNRWNDLVVLFEMRGGPHYCWCSLYRCSGKEAPATKAEKKSNLERLVCAGIPVGVIAYDGTKPVGWCSVAPRETYQKLEKSRKMPRVTNSETLTWSILCFYVHREYRGQQVASKLLEGAVSYARKEGAQVVEGYPYDSAGITATHRGHSSIFEKAGFHQDDNRWYYIINSV